MGNRRYLTTKFNSGACCKGNNDMKMVTEEDYRIQQHNHLFRLINIVREGCEMSLLSQAEFIEELERFSEIRPKSIVPSKDATKQSE